jgi:hypothetical protein
MGLPDGLNQPLETQFHDPFSALSAEAKKVISFRKDFSEPGGFSEPEDITTGWKDSST